MVQGTRYRGQGTGYRLQVAGYRLQVTGYKVLVIPISVGIPAGGQELNLDILLPKCQSH